MLSLEYMDSVKQWADAKGVPIHLDGARIFNAAAYLGGCCPPGTWKWACQGDVTHAMLQPAWLEAAWPSPWLWPSLRMLLHP